jgi:membrane-associated phospholipid phosphatase
MKRLIFFLCLFVIGFNLYSQNTQSMYTLDLRRDIVISASAVGSVSVYLYMALANLEHEPSTNFNRNDVNAFDRWLMFPFNQTIETARYVPLFSAMLLPIVPPLILGWGNQRGNLSTWVTYGIMSTQAFLLAYGTVGIMSIFIDRYRPNMYFEGPLHERPNSFPSSSSAVAFMSATFFTVTFSAEFPDSRWRIPVIVGSYTLASTVGAMRIFPGAHFLTDVLVGSAIGSFYGWLIPTLHRRPNNDRVSIHPTGNGLIMSVKF